MSRVGKLPVAMPSGVKANIKDGIITVEGPKGSVKRVVSSNVVVKVEADKIVVSPNGDKENRQVRADYGTARSHINNMVKGVTEGWKRSLEMVGVGFTAKMQGETITLSCGFSHDVDMKIPQGIKCTVGKTNIDMESADKELLGTFASKIRKVQPPEPYLGKGIKYSDEVVRRKAGKTGKK